MDVIDSTALRAHPELDFFIADLSKVRDISENPIPIDPERAFRDAMLDAGITPPDYLEPDGEIHRFHVEGDKRGTKNGWYLLHLDEVPAGHFGCHKRELS